MQEIFTPKENKLFKSIFIISVIFIYIIDFTLFIKFKQELLLSTLCIVNSLLFCTYILYSYVRKRRLGVFKMKLLIKDDQIYNSLIKIVLAILLIYIFYLEIVRNMSKDFLLGLSLCMISYLFYKPISISKNKIAIGNCLINISEIQNCYYQNNGMLTMLINDSETILKHLSKEEKKSILKEWTKYLNDENEKITAHNTTSEQRSTGE